MKLFLALFLFSELAFAKLPSPVENCFQALKEGEVQELSYTYAQYFKTYKKGDIHLLQSGEDFLFLEKFQDKRCPELIHVRLPLERVVSYSTTYLSYLQLLGKDQLVIGVSGKDYVNNPKILQGLRDKKVKDIQYPPREELLLSLNPGGIFSYGVSQADKEKNERMRRLGLPLIPVWEYKERDPLARAQWLIFFASFFGEEKKAEQIFEQKRADYLGLLRKLENPAFRPPVMVGEFRNGLWYAPQADSDFVRLINSSGGRYLFSEIKSKGPLVLSSEKVYELLQREKTKVFWFPQNLVTSLSELKGASSLYERLKIFDKVEIYNNNLKRNPQGYSEYWESAMTHPDLLLKDVVRILHPELLPEHKLLWYWKL